MAGEIHRLKMQVAETNALVDAEVKNTFPKSCIVAHTRLPFIAQISGYITSVDSPTIDLLSVEGIMCYKSDEAHDKGRSYGGGLWDWHETIRVTPGQIHKLDPDNVTGYGG